ncbi:MAG: helix-turn-helix domain-containing protein [Pseudonocardia sp.]
MVAPQSPIGSRRRLGAELRRLRAKTGLTLDEVAEQMTCSPSKISRLETGKGIPKVPDVSMLMKIYGVASDTERDMLLRLVRDGRQQGWWVPLTEGVAPERFVFDSPARYASLENDATAIRSFDTTAVHGLLQTADYARAVVSALLPHHSAEEIERLVVLRTMRQDALHRSDPPPPRLTVVLDEAVLARPVGGPAVMTAQLSRLRELVALPHVTVRVLPFVASMVRAHAGRFVLLSIPDDLGSDVVYVEGGTGEAYLDHEPDVERYEEVFADAEAHALDPVESLEMITRYEKQHAPLNWKAPTS